MQADQADLLKPYVEKYFEGTSRIWVEWGGNSARVFAQQAYPSLIISHETVDRTDRHLAVERPLGALSRLLIEGRDGIVRALCAQAKDLQGKCGGRSGSGGKTHRQFGDPSQRP